MKTWPHAPLHRLNEQGTYIVTGSTLNKICFFKRNEELEFLHDDLIDLAEYYEWRLEAWAVFSNHYHFIAHSPQDPSSLRNLIKHFHSLTARKLNASHKQQGRKIWYQYWDTRITFQTSYMARLNYVINNAVKHKIVTHATDYPWCSATWFKNNSSKSHYNTVMSFDSESVNVIDDFY